MLVECEFILSIWHVMCRTPKRLQSMPLANECNKLSCVSVVRRLSSGYLIGELHLIYFLVDVT